MARGRPQGAGTDEAAMTFTEIGLALGITHQAAEQIARRALRKLRASGAMEQSRQLRALGEQEGRRIRLESLGRRLRRKVMQR